MPSPCPPNAVICGLKTVAILPCLPATWRHPETDLGATRWTGVHHSPPTAQNGGCLHGHPGWEKSNRSTMAVPESSNKGRDRRDGNVPRWTVRSTKRSLNRNPTAVPNRESSEPTVTGFRRTRSTAGPASMPRKVP